jgi:hypothetical protein
MAWVVGLFMGWFIHKSRSDLFAWMRLDRLQWMLGPHGLGLLLLFANLSLVPRMRVSRVWPSPEEVVTQAGWSVTLWGTGQLILVVFGIQPIRAMDTGTTLIAASVLLWIGFKNFVAGSTTALALAQTQAALDQQRRQSGFAILGFGVALGFLGYLVGMAACEDKVRDAVGAERKRRR